MSLLPFVIRDMVRPLRMLENQMRLAEEFFHPFSSPIFSIRPRIAVEYPEENTKSDKEKFQVKLDVQGFKPEEITVKTLDDNSIQIEAKHEEKQDKHGFISRQFVRRFVLPQGHDLKNTVSSLSSDGILTVTAPKLANMEVQEKVIPITVTGPEKENQKESEKIDNNK